MIAECNYGGHIADEWDRRCLKILVEQLLLQEPDLIDTSKLMRNLPRDGKYESFVTYIKGLPLDGSATDFGLHSNAEILREWNESDEFLNRIDSSEHKWKQPVEQFTDFNNELVASKIDEILCTVPLTVNLEGVKDDTNKDCLNVILLQELLQYKDLLTSIRSDCTQVFLAIKGKSTNLLTSNKLL